MCQLLCRHLVTRKDCCKGCEGRVLRSIQVCNNNAASCFTSEAHLAVWTTQYLAPVLTASAPPCLLVPFLVVCCSALADRPSGAATAPPSLHLHQQAMQQAALPPPPLCHQRRCGLPGRAAFCVHQLWLSAPCCANGCAASSSASGIALATCPDCVHTLLDVLLCCRTPDSCTSLWMRPAPT
jgi:hypothetical protein